MPILTYLTNIRNVTARKTTLFLSIVFSFSLFQNSLSSELERARKYCQALGVDPHIVEAIANVESVKKKGRWYPFVIRLNNKNFYIKGLPVLKKYGSDVYDCINAKICTVVAKKLVEAGITNIDLGVFQINYKYYSGDKKKLLREAFSIPSSYKIACRIVAENLKKHGYNVYAVALYHSAKPDRNRKYAQKFLKAYRKILLEKVSLK